tara:strand:- start:111 stop:260 length:150 start_codon:yes stop_codon:yes gene_type:complete
MSIFDMGDYNFYVWSSVFISILALFLTYFDAKKKHKDATIITRNMDKPK